ncbi:MAG: glycoside hydrolase family 18 protein [Steroidobacteraceae bacterium]
MTSPVLAWRLRRAALFGAIACLAGCAAAAPAPQHFRIVAYVAGWSPPAVIHAEKLTHINFAFAKIDGAGKVAFEDPRFASTLKSLLALRKQNPQLKVIVSVGGWTADGFSDAALTEASRNTFAQSVVELLREHAVDGIDLDWEYPGQGVAGIKYRAEDKQNFTLLLKTLRAQLDAASDAERRSGRERYVLTIASADREYFDHTAMEKLHVYLDWLNIMSYDFFNSLTPTTGHHAGLHASEFAAPTDRNADASVRQHLAAGIPPDKLVLGVAFYGRGFAGVKPLNNGLNQPYERYEGDHSYAELADELIGSQGFVRHWDQRAKAPFLWNGGARTFITYDDPQSIRAKADYARENRLGGMMFWELSQDRNDELLDVIVTSLDSQP